MKSLQASKQFSTVVCWSHLRWEFVFQRPQHLMTRWAERGRVIFIEEPIERDGPPRIEARGTDVVVVTPHVPTGLEANERMRLVRDLLHPWLAEQGVDSALHWFYTPMMYPLFEGLPAAAVVFDCMDELSAFAHAPPELRLRERALMTRADVVFTGGRSLYEAKVGKHANVHCLPSSVDAAHFRKARDVQADPADQASIPHPRVGYVGVVDERMNIELIAELAQRRPDWHIVMVGPVVKIDPAQLPRAANIHWLGMKSYAELPSYLAGWDVALLPFAHNESTRFISPTKTPEYMAAGLPVVSTSVRDVVRPYGELELVHIADDAAGFERSITAALAGDAAARRARHDEHLSTMSWNRTFEAMRSEIERAMRAPKHAAPSASATVSAAPSASSSTAANASSSSAASASSF